MRNFTLFAFVILACVPNFVSAHPPTVVLPDARLWTPPRDPFPIRRVFLSPQQHAELTLPPGQAPLVRLSREEFERRVRTAAVAVETNSPFLSDARYVATYSEGSLAGTAEWTVVNPSRKSGTLRLDPLRIAISDAVWEKGTNAILSRSSTNGSDENSKTVVEVEAAIPTSGTLLRCKWSARPTDDRGDRRFDLRFPSATIARIELSLPLALSPAVRRDRAILTGPFATDDPTTRRWSIALGGQDSCELTIRTGAALSFS